MTSPPPPEWAPAARIFTAWPWLEHEWEGGLEAPRRQTAALVRTIAQAGTPVTLLVPDARAEDEARAIVGGSENVTYRQSEYGDIWLRDTGPIFTAEGAQAFAFNGWGGKYRMPGDEKVAGLLAETAGAALKRHDFILEGGAIDHDGTGLAITTEQCLLNPNRNPEMNREALDAALAETLGLKRLIWLGRGLARDHTDGHVDNLARFVAPGKVVVPEAQGAEDPNAFVYEDAARRLAVAEIEVVRIPSPSRVSGPDGSIVPASYVNFLITNELVVVPTYGSAMDEAAVSALDELFPGRRTVGLDASAILGGGGAFHCMTRELPAGLAGDAATHAS